MKLIYSTDLHHEASLEVKAKRDFLGKILGRG